MPPRVLVPIDDSPQAEKALQFAADEWPDAEFVLLHVIDPVEAGYSPSVLPSGSEEWYEQAKSNAEKLFAQAREAMGRDAETRVEVGRPSRTIVDVAEAADVDHVVIGSHGRTGVSRVLLGSVAEHAVRRSPVPVTVVR
ncbi:universal stress protein [Haloplanus sp. GCM10025708]|uniref:universal stress protein n=1 Tax=Haloferacaceae TaxID=1644056 RepID=UPI003609381B